MPVIHVLMDHFGPPTIELAVSIGTSDRVTQPDDAILPPRIVQALVDTGASRSHVDVNILESLRLVSVEDIAVYTASTGNQPEVMPLYAVNLSLAGDHPGPLACNLRVVGSDRLDGLRVDMLLGRDVLGDCLSIYDGINRRFSLAYNPPVQDSF